MLCDAAVVSSCWHAVLPRMQHLLHMLQDAACSLRTGQVAANTCACTHKEMRCSSLSAGEWKGEGCLPEIGGAAVPGTLVTEPISRAGCRCK